MPNKGMCLLSILIPKKYTSYMIKILKKNTLIEQSLRAIIDNPPSASHSFENRRISVPMAQCCKIAIILNTWTVLLYDLKHFRVIL